MTYSVIHRASHDSQIKFQFNMYETLHIGPFFKTWTGSTTISMTIFLIKIRVVRGTVARIQLIPPMIF